MERIRRTFCLFLSLLTACAVFVPLSGCSRNGTEEDTGEPASSSAPDTPETAESETSAVTTAAPKPAVVYKLPFKKGVNVNGLEGHVYTDELNFNKDTFCYYLSREETFTQIRDKGFDHVCMGVDMPKYYDEAANALVTSGSYDIANVDGIIRRAIDAGLYIMIRCHGWWDFASNDPAQYAKFVKMWACFAEHYKDYDEKLIFNLQGEPRYSGNSDHNLNKVQNETVAAIRKTNPTRLILLTVTDSCQPWLIETFSPPAGDRNIALVIHLYNPGDFTHQGATWSDPKRDHQVRMTNEHLTTLQWDMDQISGFMRKHPDIPIVLNEFSVQQNVANKDDIVTWLTKIRTFCESNGIPWTYWQYCDYPSITSIRAFADKNGIPYTEEQLQRFVSEGMGARYGWDEDWKDYVMKGLGLE